MTHGINGNGTVSVNDSIEEKNDNDIEYEFFINDETNEKISFRDMINHRDNHDNALIDLKNKLSKVRIECSTPNREADFDKNKVKMIIDSSSPGTGKTVSDITNTLEIISESYNKLENKIRIYSSIFASANIKQNLDNVNNGPIRKKLRDINGKEYVEGKYPILFFQNPAVHDLFRFDSQLCHVINKKQLSDKATFFIDYSSILDFLSNKFGKEFEDIRDENKDGFHKKRLLKSFKEQISDNYILINKISKTKDDEENYSDLSRSSQSTLNLLTKTKDNICDLIISSENGLFRSSEVVDGLFQNIIDYNDEISSNKNFEKEYHKIFREYHKVINEAISYIYYNDDLFVAEETSGGDYRLKISEKPLDNNEINTMKEKQVHFVLFLMLFQPTIFAQFTSSMFFMTHKKLFMPSMFKFVCHNPKNKKDKEEDPFKPTFTNVSLFEFGDGVDFNKNQHEIAILSDLAHQEDSENKVSAKLKNITLSNVTSSKSSIFPSGSELFKISHRVTIDEYPTFEEKTLHDGPLHLGIIEEEDNINDLAITLGGVFNKFSKCDDEQISNIAKSKSNHHERILDKILKANGVRIILDIVRQHIKENISLKDVNIEDELKKQTDITKKFFIKCFYDFANISLSSCGENKILHATMETESHKRDSKDELNKIKITIRHLHDNSLIPFSTKENFDDKLYFLFSEGGSGIKSLQPCSMEKSDLLNLANSKEAKNNIKKGWACSFNASFYLYDSADTEQENDKYKIFAIPASYFFSAITAVSIFPCLINEYINNGRQNDRDNNIALSESAFVYENPYTRRNMDVAKFSFDDTINNMVSRYDRNNSWGYIREVIKYAYTSERFQNDDEKVNYIQSHIIPKMLIRYKVAELSKSQKSETGSVIDHLSIEARVRVASAQFLMWYLMNMPTLQIVLLSATMNHHNSELGEVKRDLIRLEEMSGSNPIETIKSPDKNDFREINDNINNLKRQSHSVEGVQCNEIIEDVHVQTEYGRGGDARDKIISAFHDATIWVRGAYEVSNLPSVFLKEGKIETNITNEGFLYNSVENIHKDINKHYVNCGLGMFKINKGATKENDMGLGIGLYTNKHINKRTNLNSIVRKVLGKGLFGDEYKNGDYEINNEITKIIKEIKKKNNHSEFSDYQASEIINQLLSLVMSVSTGRSTLSFSRRNTVSEIVILHMRQLLYRCRDNEEDVKKELEQQIKKGKEDSNTFRYLKLFLDFISMNEDDLKEKTKNNDIYDLKIKSRIRVPAGLIYDNAHKTKISLYKGIKPNKTVSETFKDGILLVSFIAGEAKKLNTDIDLFLKNKNLQCLPYVMSSFGSAGESYNIPLITNEIFGYINNVIQICPLDSDFDRLVLLSDVYYSRLSDITERNKVRNLLSNKKAEPISMKDATIAADLSIRIAATENLKWSALSGGEGETNIQSSLSHEHHSEMNKKISQIIGRVDRRYRNNDLEIMIFTNNCKSNESSNFIKVLEDQLIYVNSEIGFDGKKINDSDNALFLSVARNALLTTACYYFKDYISAPDDYRKIIENTMNDYEGAEKELYRKDGKYGEEGIYKKLQEKGRNSGDGDEIIASEIRGDDLLEAYRMISNMEKNKKIVDLYNALQIRLIALKAQNKNVIFAKTLEDNSKDLDSAITNFGIMHTSSKKLFSAMTPREEVRVSDYDKTSPFNIYISYEDNGNKIVDRIPSGTRPVKYAESLIKYMERFIAHLSEIDGAECRDAKELLKCLKLYKNGDDNIKMRYYGSDIYAIIVGNLGEIVFNNYIEENNSFKRLLKDNNWELLKRHKTTVKIGNEVKKEITSKEEYKDIKIKNETQFWDGKYCIENNEENVILEGDSFHIAYERADFFFINRSENKIIAIDIKNFTNPDSKHNLSYYDKVYGENSEKFTKIKEGFKSLFAEEPEVELYVINVNPKPSLINSINGPLMSLYSIKDCSGRLGISKTFENIFRKNNERQDE